MGKTLAMLVFLALFMTCTGAAGAGAEPEKAGPLAMFGNISLKNGAGFRYSIPGGVTAANKKWLDQVEAELREMAAQGFYYVEVVSGNTSSGKGPEGVDSDAWRTVLKRVYSVCNETGMSARLHIGYTNAGELFAMEDEDSDYTEAGRRKKLSDALVDVEGGYRLAGGTGLPVLGEADVNASTALIHVMAAKYTARPAVVEVRQGRSFMSTTVEKEVQQRTLLDVVHIPAGDVKYDREANTLVYTGKALTLGSKGENWSIIAYYQGAMVSETGTGPGAGVGGAPQGGMPGGSGPEGGMPSGGPGMMPGGDMGGMPPQGGMPGGTGGGMPGGGMPGGEMPGGDMGGMPGGGMPGGGKASRPVYSVNYYTVDGMKAFTDTYDNDVFDDELKKLVRANGGGFMEDGGDQAPQFADDAYSENLFAAYPELMGYEIEDYLPIFYSDFWTLEDEETVKMLRSDKLEVLSTLYREALNYLSKWAEKNYNGNWIHQAAYSTDLDSMTAWMAVTQPECESLFFSDNIGGYVAITSAARMMGNKIVSCEMGGQFNNPYNSELYKLISQTNYGLVGGVNQMSLHDYSSLYSNNCKWPGNNQFYNQLATWESTQPLWETIGLYADYTNRAQYIIRLGAARRDVLVYRHSHEALEGYFNNYDSMLEYGYTFDYVNPDLLQLDDLKMVTGGVIDPYGGAYKAVVVDNLLHGDDMSTASAGALLRYAEAGIPVFVIRTIPTRVESLKDDANLLSDIWAKIEATGNMILVKDEADLGGALLERGVASNLVSSRPSKVTSFMSAENGSNYYFIFNRGDSYTDVVKDKRAVHEVIRLRGEGQPYEVNLWTGEVTKMADFTLEDGYVSVPLDLEIGATTAIVVTDEPARSLHAAPKAGLDFAYVDDALALKVTKAGKYAVTLSDGTTKHVVADRVASAPKIDDWTLTVEKWEPANDYKTTVGEAATETKKTDIGPIALGKLVSWSQIEELGDEVSGIGCYTANFSLDGPYDGAILELGELFDIVRVYVNGREVVADALNGRADLSGVLTQGENELKLVLPTNLENEMLAIGAFTLRSEDAPVLTDEEIIANDLKHRSVGAWAHSNDAFLKRDYGIWGPVTISPYVYVTVE